MRKGRWMTQLQSGADWLRTQVNTYARRFPCFFFLPCFFHPSLTFFCFSSFFHFFLVFLLLSLFFKLFSIFSFCFRFFHPSFLFHPLSCFPPFLPLLSPLFTLPLLSPFLPLVSLLFPFSFFFSPFPPPTLSSSFVSLFSLSSLFFP